MVPVFITSKLLKIKLSLIKNTGCRLLHDKPIANTKNSFGILFLYSLHNIKKTTSIKNQNSTSRFRKSAGKVNITLLLNFL